MQLSLTAREQKNIKPNLTLLDGSRPARKFNDEEVCKYALCGFCPYEEFDKTRTDYGACPAVHDDRCKTQWEALTDEERAKYPYERELKKWLDKMVDDLGKKVKRNQERLDSEANPSFLPDDQVCSRWNATNCLDR